MRRPHLIRIVALATTFICTDLLAADFTLNVPLRVENVPSMERIVVSCYVSKVPIGGISRAAGTNVVGRGSSTVNVVGGRYSGTAQVLVNASGINPASSGKSYTCSLSANGRATTGATYAVQSGNFETVYETATGHELSRYTVTTSANF